MANQVEKLMAELKSKYGVDPEAFLELYKAGLNAEDMSETLSTTKWAIRIYSSTLNLRLPKKYRSNDLALFFSRFSESAESKITGRLIESDENLEHLSKQLVQKEKTISSLKAEVTKYKKGLQKEIAQGSVEDFIKEAVSGISNAKAADLRINLQGTSYSEHTQLLLLSDNHVEECVNSTDVGKANEYNWDIMEQRLGRLFSELLNSYRGESRVVVASLGDQFSGTIYDTLESTGKSLGLAITEYATILANYLKSLSTVYDEVYVPVVHGNHGRYSQNKKSSNFGTNNYEYLMANILKALVAGYPNIIVDISTTGFIAFNVGECVVGGHHGDFFRSVGDVKFMRVKEHFRQTLGVEPDVILQGHTHNFSIEQMPRGGTYITNASLIGVSGYTHSNGFMGKRWGQVIMSFLPTGKVENVRLVGDE